MRVPFMRHVAWCLVVAMFIIGVAPKVDAGFVQSDIINLTKVDRAVDVEKIQKVLETKAIRARLAQLGLTQDEIQNRLNQLSDEQIHSIALNLDQLKVGGIACYIWIIASVVVVIAALYFILD